MRKQRKDSKKRFCTLKDVASLAGVSYATVSNYLNRRELLKKDTAGRVADAIKKLKYTPALTARQLKLQQTDTIGIIVPDIVNNYYATVSKTIEEIMRKKGFETVIYNTNYLPEEEESALDFFISKRIRGLMLMSIRREFKRLSSIIENHRLPVVVIDNYVRGLGSWTIVQDNYRGAYRLIDHLAREHGYRDIAFISSDSKVTTVRERIKGYMSALEDNQIPVNEDYIVEGSFDPMHGYEAAIRLLEMENPPRAISASTSMYSIGILKAINSKRLRIPEDIAITSFDDYDFAEVTNPSITALKRVDHMMGEKAAGIMLELIMGKLEIKNKTIRIDTPLITRCSCGCVVK